MSLQSLMSVAAVVLATAAVGCSSPDPAEDRETRGSNVVSACRDHGGVRAFDDEAVICADQTFKEERGANAVEACRGHGGVVAFDDDIVVCRDQTFHEAAGG